MSIRHIGYVAAVCTAVVAPVSAQQADLRYVAGDARATFVTVDTTDMTMSTGQSMQASMRSVVELGLAEGDSGLVAKGTLKELRGNVSTPMGDMPAPSATDVPVSISITGKGPDAAEAAKLGNGLGGEVGMLAHTRMMAALPMMPGRALRIGETWVDTVHVDTEQDGIALKGTTIISGTYRADSTANGRAVNIVDIVSVTSMSGTGTMQGTAVDQTMKIDGTVRVLWDQARHLPVRQEANMTMNMQMIAGGMNMDMQGRTRSVTVEGS